MLHNGEVFNVLFRFFIILYCILVNQFVSALAADGAIDEDSISSAELQKIYGPLTQRVNENLSKQEQIMSQIQVCVCVTV